MIMPSLAKSGVAGMRVLAPSPANSGVVGRRALASSPAKSGVVGMRVLSQIPAKSGVTGTRVLAPSPATRGKVGMGAAAVLLLCLAFAMPVLAQIADPFEHPTSGAALLSTTLAAPARNLANAKVLTGRFVHQKHLSEVPRPLVANGEFTYARGLGVYWHTQQPFDSVFVLTQQGIVQRDEGAETMRLSSQEQPAVRVIADIFLALFTLDVSSLSASFDLFGKSQGARWIVGLKPKNATIGSVFTQATITGAADVEQVVLLDAHGDRTIIELKDILYSPAEPGADVKSLFTR